MLNILGYSLFLGPLLLMLFSLLLKNLNFSGFKLIVVWLIVFVTVTMRESILMFLQNLDVFLFKNKLPKLLN